MNISQIKQSIFRYGDKVHLISLHNDFKRYSKEMFEYEYKVLNKQFKNGVWLYQLEYVFVKGNYTVKDVLNNVWEDEISCG